MEIIGGFLVLGKGGLRGCGKRREMEERGLWKERDEERDNDGGDGGIRRVRIILV